MCYIPSTDFINVDIARLPIAWQSNKIACKGDAYRPDPVFSIHPAFIDRSRRNGIIVQIAKQPKSVWTSSKWIDKINECVMWTWYGLKSEIKAWKIGQQCHDRMKYSLDFNKPMHTHTHTHWDFKCHGSFRNDERNKMRRKKKTFFGPKKLWILSISYFNNSFIPRYSNSMCAFQKEWMVNGQSLIWWSWIEFFFSA